jgi:hypothetical protein
LISLSHLHLTINCLCCQVLKNAAAAEKDEAGEKLAHKGGNLESEQQEDEKMELVLQAVRNRFDMPCPLYVCSASCF